ncbi:MAG: ATP-dependent DNA helicase RecG [Candidatus Omnitrophica bacterium]|nr:ATP-dependent DNA helicase RecG [Candidatus Omnitrophota bacterium]
MTSKLSLNNSVQYLRGVGPERHKLLARLGLRRLGDVFYFFPRRHEIRWPVKKVSELTGEEKECVRGRVASRGLVRMRHGQTLFRAVLSDGQKAVFGTWFNQPYLVKAIPSGSVVTFYGKAEREGRQWKMVHPEYEIHADPDAESIHSGRLVPIYPLTEDLSQKAVRQIVFRVLTDHLMLLEDPIPPALRARLGLEELRTALRQIHFPDSEARRRGAYRRLVFDEFFMMQAVVQMKKNEFQKEAPEILHAGGDGVVQRLLGSAGFALTEGQKSAVEEVLHDMKRGRPMNRLVQGDVGSGKTIVSAAALAFTAANGFQGALMAPTEVLAQQHYFTLSRLFEPIGISCGFLAQSMKPREKEEVLSRALDGGIKILVGTHALIEERVRFHRLGLVVVDEQHKFGVFQREVLLQKGHMAPSATQAPADASCPPSAGRAHFLLTTATPIPRTLALTLYGDLDISTIRELPGGRKPIQTFWVGEDRRGEVYALLDALIAKGRQGYVVCPLIDEKSFSSKSVLTAHKELAAIFSHRNVGLLHGRMKGAEKEQVMRDFRERRIDLLVSTVVIEVGVDVPNASLVIVENAERFGLAQLHQLRGRVGRGSEESFCVLFSDSAAAETAERLAAFEKMESGFDIAEKDLKLRGAGDIVGEKQHGFPRLRIGDLVQDMGILIEARKEAERLVAEDPRLESPKNRSLRNALRCRRLLEPRGFTGVVP